MKILRKNEDKEKYFEKALEKKFVLRYNGG